MKKLENQYAYYVREFCFIIGIIHPEQFKILFLFMREREKQGEEQAECRAQCRAESQDPRSCLAPKPRVGHPID